MPKKHTKIDRAMFEQVKTLQAYNIKIPVMVQITGLSPASVSRIKTAKTWSEFLELRKEHSRKANAKLAKKLMAEGTVTITRDEEAVEAIDTIAQGLNALSEAATAPTPEEMLDLFPDSEVELSLHQREVLALERTAAATERLADAWEAAPAARKSFFKG